MKDSFEDAPETSSLADSHEERSQSRSRSLLQRKSSSSTVQETKTDAPPSAPAAPAAPAAPKATKDESEDSEETDETDESDESEESESDSEPEKTEKPEKPEKPEKVERVEKVEKVEKTEKAETTEQVEKAETPSEDAPAKKSPLLTAHGVSVTSDMDDVSLDGGMYTLSRLKPTSCVNVRLLAFQRRERPHSWPCLPPCSLQTSASTHVLISRLTHCRWLQGRRLAAKTTRTKLPRLHRCASRPLWKNVPRHVPPTAAPARRTRDPRAGKARARIQKTYWPFCMAIEE